MPKLKHLKWDILGDFQSIWKIQVCVFAQKLPFPAYMNFWTKYWLLTQCGSIIKIVLRKPGKIGLGSEASF